MWHYTFHLHEPFNPSIKSKLIPIWSTKLHRVRFDVSVKMALNSIELHYANDSKSVQDEQGECHLPLRHHILPFLPAQKRIVNGNSNIGLISCSSQARHLIKKRDVTSRSEQVCFLIASRAKAAISSFPPQLFCWSCRSFCFSEMSRQAMNLCNSLFTAGGECSFNLVIHFEFIYLFVNWFSPWSRIYFAF